MRRICHCTIYYTKKYNSDTYQENLEKKFPSHEKSSKHICHLLLYCNSDDDFNTIMGRGGGL